MRMYIIRLSVIIKYCDFESARKKNTVPPDSHSGNSGKILKASSSQLSSCEKSPCVKKSCRGAERGMNNQLYLSEVPCSTTKHNVDSKTEWTQDDKGT
jgi:hypothetical protein